MEVFYKVEGTIWYGDSEAEVQSLQACLWECFGIPSDIFFKEKRSTQKFGIQFSFYKKEEYGFAEEFISLLESGMTPEDGEFYIANPYTGKNGCLSSAEASSALKLAIKKRKEKKYEYVL